MKHETTVKEMIQRIDENMKKYLKVKRSLLKYNEFECSEKKGIIQMKE